MRPSRCELNSRVRSRADFVQGVFEPTTVYFRGTQSEQIYIHLTICVCHIQKFVVPKKFAATCIGKHQVISFAN
jgi:hypothetical protein